VNRYTLTAISLWTAALVWFVGWCLTFHNRGYRRGREEGFEEGFEAGRMRADKWWLETEYEVEREREKIRHQEGKP
jgi:hypothetical protein